MRLFRRAKKPVPTKSEIEEHQDSLGFFLKRRTSVAMNGSQEDLRDATNAMYFFAHTELIPTPRAEGGSDAS